MSETPAASDPFAPRSEHTAGRARRRAQIRRRRAVALGAVAAVILAIVLVAISGGGSPRNRAAESAAAPARGGTKGKPAAPSHTSVVLALENRAIDKLLKRQQFITAGGPERREIALTFDDGPGPYTPMLLDQLKRLHVKATFFEIGFMIHYFHPSLTREVSLHMVIGDHTETHPMMAELGPAAQSNQITVQTQWLSKYGAPYPRLYRPPYGSFNSATLAILRRLRMLMVLWTVDTSDYLQPGVGVIVQRVLAGAKPGAIILMHDGGGVRTQTIEALPLIVKALRARGYRLVTVPRLVLDDPPRGVQHLPTGLAGG